MGGKMKKISFQDRLRESFRAYGNNIAVRCGTQTLTYDDLDRMSNGIANRLLDKKVNRETFIGVLMNDRVRFIYTVIGILKAGCVFVSLDPAYPDGRLALMMDFTGTSLIFTDDANRNRGGLREFTCVDDLFPGGISGGDTRPVELTYSGEDPVYVYFTSGTTGMPKGILGKNKSLWQFIEWEVRTFNVDETFRVSQLITPGFDAALRDIFVPLFTGGCICVPEDPEIPADSERLIRWIDNSGISLIHCVPSLFRVMNAGGPALTSGHFKELKYILLSGERIPPRELVRWYEIFGERIQLVNFWGPTETTMIKTFYLIRGTDVDKERIPIGKPMKGTRVVIMDGAMKVCKERIAGRLYIRTPYRSFGYCNDPELTHERFIKNPFNNDPADRLYDTGDLGRLLPDGDIEFLGREDRQVKILGVRIELEGIENILLKHPVVAEAAVVKRTVTSKIAETDDEMLCVYITRRQLPAPGENTAEDVRAHLLSELPGYMVPPLVLEIEKIPRKPNGKVDYDALPDPFKDKEKDYVPPVNDLQAKLADLWSEVLRIDRISIDRISIDSRFFELGGNSLSLMALISKIHQEFDVRIPLEKMFNNPTLESQAAVINELGREHYLAVEPVEKRDYYTLSPAQKRLYFIYRMDKNSVVYNIPLVVPVDGRLDRERLKETFKKIIKRHDAFRTTFEMVHGSPVQRVQNGLDAEFEISYTECGEAEAENIVKNFSRPFDLSKAPLLRVDLITVESTHQMLFIDMHHIVTDGASQVVLEKEFKELYAGEELAPLRLQYKDYAEWQRSEEQKLSIKEQERYWLELFPGEIPVLDLPADYSRPLMQSFEGNRVEFVLTVDESRTLRELTKETGTTLYMCILSVFTILLSRLSGQEDIVVGTPVAGRRHADLEKIIGMFVNTLVMRNKPLADRRYGEFLNELKGHTLEAYENQEYPFEELVENISVRRDLSRNPVFDVMVNIVDGDDYTYNVPDIEGAERNQYRHQEGTTKVDLAFTAVEAGERMLFTVEYCSRLFKPETIDRYISYFKRMVYSLGENSDARLFEIEIIPEEEKHRILYEFNDTASEYPGDRTIHELFDEQAERTGDKIAVNGMGQATGLPVALTYRELKKRAHGLACLLREKGVAPETIVGIKMERSVEMIVGILGVLKAGGAYLPMEPGYPQDRIDFMMNDSGAPLLLTHELLVESSVKPAVSLPPARPFHLAYVIYTSGSTGRAKGVMVQHRSLVNACEWQMGYYNIDERDHTTQYAPFVFDASLLEIFPCLLRGASLYIIAEEIKLDPRLLNRYYEKVDITFGFLPTQFCELFMELENRSLRALLAAGDVLRRFVKRNYRLYNNYGPTENTVVATSTPVEAQDGNIPIGSPVNNNRMYILDKNRMRLQPIGVPGELCIGGESLSRGYLNRPELTAEKFVRGAAPLSSLPLSPAAPLYRTGDMARWLPDGNIEFLGRTDFQLKIRGFRIEPGEIENRLLKHEAVKQVAVLLKDDRLYAYIAAEEELTAPRLRRHLAVELPGYMIPSHFVQVEDIPLTVNGKVDAKRLELSGKSLETGTAYTAPQNEIEKQVAETWKHVLARDTVGIHDNYFDLGGTSLDILKINAELKEKFQMDIPVVTMFTYPTVHSFAEFIINSQQEQVEETVDRSTVLERSKIDRREQLLRRKGVGK